MSPRSLLRVALAALVALMIVSAAFVSLSAVGGSHGAVFALVKLIALVFLFRRIRDADVYTMQWSSMLILLFMAEGAVRATSDPQPSASLGALEAVLATGYFLAILAWLRPVKKAATQAAKQAAIRREGRE